MIRYECRGELIDCGKGMCVSFGGLRVDAEVARQVLQAIEGNAIDAALQASEQMHRQRWKNCPAKSAESSGNAMAPLHTE